MKKFISLMNGQSFRYLWKDVQGKAYLTNMLNDILNEKNHYELLDYFNSKDNKNVRSYIFLECHNKIIFFDFNLYNDQIRINLDYQIMNVMQSSTSKKLFLVLFNAFNGKNKVDNNIFSIYKNKYNNKDIKFLLSLSYEEQMKYADKDIMDYLYKDNKEFYHLYLNEIKTEENIYNLFNV